MKIRSRFTEHCLIKSFNFILFVSLIGGLLSSSLLLSPLQVTAKNAFNNNLTVRRTPPAPVFSDAERQAELARRRSRIAARVGSGNLLVLMSAEPRIYTGDVDYEYRQENNFYYLTALKQEDMRLVIVPNTESGVSVAHKLSPTNGTTTTTAAATTAVNASTNVNPAVILFLPRRDPRQETWTGKMYSPQEAARISGISDIRDAGEFPAFMKALGEGKPYVASAASSLLESNNQSQTGAALARLWAARAAKQTKLLMLAPEVRARAASREWRDEARFADEWERSVSDVPIAPAYEMFGKERLIKSLYEQSLMQHAVDITTEAFGRAMGAAHKAQHEYEVEAEVEYTFKRRGADYWGYPSIVGCGDNATTLHYWQSAGGVGKNDLLLMDVGAEYDHYTADVTRTFPVSGKFTKEQAEIYNIVLAAQEAALKEIKPTASFGELNQAATRTIKEGLLKLGLITDLNSNQYRVWFMHGVSHWLGMNVHDVGGFEKLLPGTVFTVEPGIYIRPDALDNLPNTPENQKFKAAVMPAFEKYKGIGVRIEDDVLMTDTGYRMLTEKLPRTISDIERLITVAQKEVSAISRENNQTINFAKMLSTIGDINNLSATTELTTFAKINLPTTARTNTQISTTGSSFVKAYARDKAITALRSHVED